MTSWGSVQLLVQCITQPGAFFPGLLSVLSGVDRYSQLGLLECPRLLGLQSLPGEGGHAKLFSFL